MTFGISSDPETQDVMEHYPLIEAFCSALHGSGIDYDWSATVDNHFLPSQRRIILYNAYHAMNDVGMYVASIPFKITIPSQNIMGFRITTSGADSSVRYWWNKNMIADYLEDTVTSVFRDLFEKAKGQMPIISGVYSECIYNLVDSDKDIRVRLIKEKLG